MTPGLNRIVYLTTQHATEGQLQTFNVRKVDRNSLCNKTQCSLYENGRFNWTLQLTIIPRALVGYINNSFHLARKFARIFVRGHYLFREANSFPRAYPSIFSRKMEAIVFNILQIFLTTRAVLKIGEYSRIFLSFS